MSWVGLVTRIGERGCSYGFWYEDLREGGHLEDPGIVGRILLKWILNEWDEALTGLIWFRIGTGGGLL
jgi:hypothetical protein